MENLTREMEKIVRLIGSVQDKAFLQKALKACEEIKVKQEKRLKKLGFNPKRLSELPSQKEMMMLEGGARDLVSFSESVITNPNVDPREARKLVKMFLKEQKRREKIERDNRAKRNATLAKVGYYTMAVLSAAGLTWLMAEATEEVSKATVSAASTLVSVPLGAMVEGLSNSYVGLNNAVSMACEKVSFGYANCNEKLEYSNIQEGIEEYYNSINDFTQSALNVKNTKTYLLVEVFLFIINLLMIMFILFFIRLTSGVKRIGFMGAYVDFTETSKTTIVTRRKTKKDRSRSRSRSRDRRAIENRPRRRSHSRGRRMSLSPNN